MPIKSKSETSVSIEDSERLRLDPDQLEKNRRRKSAKQIGRTALKPRTEMADGQKIPDAMISAHQVSPQLLGEIHKPYLEEHRAWYDKLLGNPDHVEAISELDSPAREGLGMILSTHLTLEDKGKDRTNVAAPRMTYLRSFVAGDSYEEIAAASEIKDPGVVAAELDQIAVGLSRRLDNEKQQKIMDHLKKL